MRNKNAELFDDYPRGTFLLGFTTCIQITHVAIGHDDASFLKKPFGFSASKGFTCPIDAGKVIGDCNDYVGKGMNGGRILAVAPESSSFASQAKPSVVGCGLIGSQTDGEPGHTEQPRLANSYSTLKIIGWKRVTRQLRLGHRK